MTDLSFFESRTGTLSCTSEEVYNFVTDIRNFEQFIPADSIKDWHAESDTCSFNISVAGTVSVRIIKKEPHGKVVFNGDALKKNDFTLVMNILTGRNSAAEVKILLEAELNPILKMMASKPINQFLEMLIVEMEKFRNWRDIIK